MCKFIVPSAVAALAVSLFHTGVSGAQPVHDSDNKRRLRARQSGMKKQKPIQPSAAAALAVSLFHTKPVSRVQPSLEPKVFVPDFVSQLWRKSGEPGRISHMIVAPSSQPYLANTRNVIT